MEQKNQPALVVGIGASTGGLQSLRPLVRDIDANTPHLILIAHHVAASQSSNLAEILASHASVAVSYAQDGMPLLPRQILVCPPGWDMLVEGDGIRLVEPEGNNGVAPSIDRFFASLAEGLGRRAMAVVLSGAGQDGTEGARQVAAAGGLVIAQAPDQAVHPSMPESVLEADVADLVGDASQIAAWINQPEPFLADKASYGETDDKRLADLLQQVAAATDLDLSQYKETTLRRQVIRRYRSLGLASLSEYLQYIDRDRDELISLYQCFLISVTAFFRDQEVYAALRPALSQALARHPPGESFRVWVAGCATGEEAYSLAIEIMELLGAAHYPLDVRVFATDIDQRALERARAGLFSQEAVALIPPARRDRWFVANGATWQISKLIRDLVVFSLHDVTANPPFIRMDLVSCRNLLIYLKPEQQLELIRTFHYSLHPDGLLLLGRSESIGAGSKLFSVKDADAKLYCRSQTHETQPLRQLRFRSQRISKIPSLPRAADKTQRQSQIDAAQAALAVHYAPPSVLVNANFEPVRFFGRAQRYFSLVDDNADFAVFSLCLPELRSELKALCFRLLQENANTLEGNTIQLRHPGLPEQMRPVLRRVDGGDRERESSLLICFEESSVPNGSHGQNEAVSGNTADQSEILSLRKELADTREHLQAVIEELETSNEELQSLNEEVQSSSEELQASNEELQSSNEELTTLNDELRTKSLETIQLNTTLANIQNSLRSSLVVVDREGKIARFNGLASRVFGIVASDVGQLLLGVPCHLRLPQLRQQMEQVIHSNISVRERVHQGDFHYLMQIDPYHDEFDQVAGAILTFNDIAELHQAESAKARLEQRFRLVWETSMEGMLVVNTQGLIEMCNPALAKMFGYDQESLIGQAIELLLPVPLQEEHAKLRSAFLQGTLGRSVGPMRDVSGRHASGWEFSVEISLGAFDLEGEHFVLATVNDISARKEAVIALRRSEEQLRFALSASNAGVWVWDVQTNANHWSDNLWQLYGLADKAVPASFDTWLSSIRPEDQAAVAHTVVEAAQEQQKFELEWQVNTPAGEPPRWLFARGLPTFDEAGRLSQYHGIVLDISSRKQNELDLHKYATLFDSAGWGMLVVDAVTDKITHANQAFARMNGYDLSEVVGRPCQAFYAPEARATDHFTRLHQDDHQIFESVLVRKDGSRFPCHVAISTIRDQNGELMFRAATFEDLSERKQLERQLLEWANAFQQAELGLAISDVQSGRLTAVNPAFARRRGYEPAELVGAPILSLFPSHQHAKLQAHIAQMDQSGHGVFESEHVTKQGVCFPVMLDITVTKSKEGLPLVRVAYALDISERKAAELELSRHRQHLEELVANRTLALTEAMSAAEKATLAKSAFLANMSHEIRTPLNAILGMSHLIRKAGLAPEQNQRFDKLEASASHLLEVINSILDISKIEAGKFELEDERIDVEKIAATCVAILMERAQAKGLSLMTDIAPLPAGLHGDGLRIQQALLNYLTNAIRFTESGNVSLRVELLGESQDDVLLRFSVTDTGIGVAPDALPRLFKAFEQADNSMTRKYGGTGLGLAITKRIAGLMGGDAGASSTPGCGSTFWFTVHLKKCNDAALQDELLDQDAAEDVLKAEFPGTCVLVAEDEPINQEILEFILGDLGFVVDSANDGREAVRKVQERRYDLILMDMQMPHLNGLDATQQIRQLPCGAEVPIIALTANAFPEDRLRCEQAGMNDFVAKPVDPPILFAVMHRWLAKEKARRG